MSRAALNDSASCSSVVVFQGFQQLDIMRQVLSSTTCLPSAKNMSHSEGTLAATHGRL